MICPCCSGKMYSECCKIFHDGVLPNTALLLMRSRYSAYALKNAEYIMNTTHPDSPSFVKNRETWKQSIIEFTNLSVFEKLEILDHGDNWVHFIAHLGNAILEERSNFTKVNGKWLYINGELKLSK